jgi:hypothetical protein
VLVIYLFFSGKGAKDDHEHIFRDWGLPELPKMRKAFEDMISRSIELHGFYLVDL